MATITSWTGNIMDIGPMYPWVGTEFLMVVLAVVFWVGWHALQLSVEDREFREDAERLRNEAAMRHALDREG